MNSLNNEGLIIAHVCAHVFVYICCDPKMSLIRSSLRKYAAAAVNRLRKSMRRNTRRQDTILRYIHFQPFIASMVSLPEGPFELLFGRSGTGHINGQQELFEVNVSILVGIEGSENVIAELLGVSTREKHLVHVDELDGGESAVGTVLFEPLVPLLDGVFVVTRVSLEELQVLLGQTLLGLDTTHAVSLTKALPF